jgi:DNA replication protein DnaC
MHAVLETQLKTLRLPGIAKLLLVRLHEAEANHLAYADFLSRLVEDELKSRCDRLLGRRLRIARFPGTKSLDSFDYSFNQSVRKQKIMELATCAYIASGQNVLLIGPPGVGKTHLAIGLGITAIEKGYEVAYRSIFDLSEDLLEANVEGKRRDLIQELVKPSLLIIDELGMKRLPPHAAEDLLEVFHRRYQKKSTIICTNRPIDEWGQYFEDAAATTAILDRILEGVHLVKITGKSYRLGKVLE